MRRRLLATRSIHVPADKTSWINCQDGHVHPVAVDTGKAKVDKGLPLEAEI